MVEKTNNPGILCENCWNLEGDTDFWVFGFIGVSIFVADKEK